MSFKRAAKRLVDSASISNIPRPKIMSGNSLLNPSNPAFKRTKRAVDVAMGASIIGGAGYMAGGLGKKKAYSEVMTPVRMLGKKANPVNMEQVEHPNMLADGVGGELPSAAPTLGAEGSMVFGMNNRKQGGYL